MRWVLAVSFNKAGDALAFFIQKTNESCFDDAEIEKLKKRWHSYTGTGKKIWQIKTFPLTHPFFVCFQLSKADVVVSDKWYVLNDTEKEEARVLIGSKV